jgi:ribosomal protein S18 acetylase RimI-like enzyme
MFGSPTECAAGVKRLACYRRAVISLRPATAADLAALFALREVVFRPHIEQIWGWDDVWQQRRFTEDCAASETSVVDWNGRTAGYLQTVAGRDELYLRTLALHPDAQGQGFGTALVRHLQQDAAAEGIPVKLAVFATNRRAETFYLRLGFARSSATTELIEMTWRPVAATLS